MRTPLPNEPETWGCPIEPKVLNWAEEEPLDCYFVSSFRYFWVDDQASRSAFFEESNLLQAQRQVKSMIESFNPQDESTEEETCCDEHTNPGDLLREMDDTLSAFLALPITPLPELPYEIIRQIVTWAIRMNYDIRWTLISKDALTWVEPIIFKYIDTSSCQIFFPKTISPRYEHAGTLVQTILVFGDTGHQSEDFTRLFSRVPNLKILTLYQFDGSIFPHLALPYLTRLDPSGPLTFGVVGKDGIRRPDFSAPLFQNLTHIDIHLPPSSQEMLSEGWQWSFESMTRLQFVRFYQYTGSEAFYPYFHQHILSRFPPSLRGCLICGEGASQTTVDAFLALDPRLVWGFDSEEVPQDAECRMLAKTRNRVVLYNSMCTDTDIACDGWSKEMVEAIEKDKILSIAGDTS